MDSLGALLFALWVAAQVLAVIFVKSLVSGERATGQDELKVLRRKRSVDPAAEAAGR